MTSELPIQAHSKRIGQSRTNKTPPIDKMAVLAAMSGRWLQFYQDHAPLTQQSERDWRGPCPIHGGDNPAGFSIDPATGVWCCHTKGCGKPGGDALGFLMLMENKTFPEALARLADFAEIARADVSITNPRIPQKTAAAPTKKEPGPIVAAYDYTDAKGELLFQVTRHDPKTFRQRRPDGKGGWVNNLAGVAPVLYRLPELLAAPTRTVWVVEGEKDADALAALGLIATTNSGGAGKWRPCHTEALAGRNVVILPDNDPVDPKTGRRPGPEHAQEVAASLATVARNVRVLELPGLPDKGDVSYWLGAGGTLETLKSLMADAPAWQSDDTAEPAPGPVLRLVDVSDDTPPVADPAPSSQEADGQSEEWHFSHTTPASDSQWLLNDGGVCRVQGSGERAVTVPVLGHKLHVGGRVQDLDTDSESITLVWDRDGQWRTKTVPQRTVASTREIITLADTAFLVNSGNAKDVVAYIAHLQSHHKNIPLTRAVSSCGWKSVGGTKVFMWGGAPLCAHGEDVPAISFIPETPESQELTRAFRSGGTMEGWQAMAAELARFPLVAFGVAASCLSPFLEELDMKQNPIIDYAGKSSSGKTTVHKIAASVWGYAPENAGGLIRSWNSTSVFLERMAHATDGLPIFLDESHIAKPENVQQGLYQLANGTGKGRGAMAGGTQRTARFRSVVFSAGEAKLTSASTHDGAQARVVTFWGSPFGASQGPAVRDLTEGAVSHFGHAGPFLIRLYLTNRKRLLATMRTVQEASTRRLTSAVSDAIGERLVATFAAVEAVGTFASEALGLGWDMTKIVDDAFSRASASRPISNTRNALEQVVSWADGNAHLFINSPTFDPDKTTEKAGKFMADGSIALLPDRLNRLLTERQHSYESTTSNWRDTGWLDAPSQQCAKVVKFEGSPRRMIVITRAAVCLARGVDDDTTSQVTDE